VVCGGIHAITVAVLATAPVTLTFDLVNLKSRGHLLHMAIEYVKYEDFVINSFYDNEQKPF
jgi:hypothetical protein